MVIYIFLDIFYLKGSKYYEFKHQLTIPGVYNYRGIILLIAIFIYKNNNHLFCYDFTYHQCTISLRISENITTTSHLSIVLYINRLL